MPSFPPLAQGAAPASPFNVAYFGMLAAVMGIWYALVIRPQRQQESKRKAMLAQLKVGDKVVTSSGLIGSLDRVGEDTCRLRIADNVRVEILRSAITGPYRSEAAENSK